MNRGEGKTFGPDGDARVRAALRRLIAEMGTQTAVAKALGVSQPAVSAVLSSKSNAGPRLAQRLASHFGLTLDQLTQGHDDPKLPPETWARLPWWDATLAHARQLYPSVTAAAWEWLGSLRGEPPPPDALALGQIAATWDQAQARTQPAAQRSA